MIAGNSKKSDAVLLDDHATSDDDRATPESAMIDRKSFPGGKNGAGVYQSIINLMPPHEQYIESFLGSGAILRNKRPAARNIGIDLDASALIAIPGDAVPELHLLNTDAVKWLEETGAIYDRRTLIYNDPPYLLSTRKSKSPIYTHEMMSEEEHTRLLDVLLSLNCMVMISGYDSELYNKRLRAWRKASFWTTTRGGSRALENVWMNFPEPLELHDYRFLGKGFRERERIKRKRARWRARLERMPALERHALMATIDELRSSIAGNGVPSSGKSLE